MKVNIVNQNKCNHCWGTWWTTQLQSEIKNKYQYSELIETIYGYNGIKTN